MRFPFWKRKQRDEELNEEIQAHLSLSAREEMEFGQSGKDAQLGHVASIRSWHFGTNSSKNKLVRSRYSPRIISAVVSRLRIIRNFFPSTITSAGRGREL